MLLPEAVIPLYGIQKKIAFIGKPEKNLQYSNSKMQQQVNVKGLSLFGVTLQTMNLSPSPFTYKMLLYIYLKKKKLQ